MCSTHAALERHDSQRCREMLGRNHRRECRGHRWVELSFDAARLLDMTVIESREVKDMLKETFSKLTKACPSVLQDEFQKLVALDANMFVKLVEQRQSIELE